MGSGPTFATDSNDIHNLFHSRGRSTSVILTLVAALAGLLWSGVLVLRADTHYVATSALSVSPYTSWANAASNIQWAVNVSTNGETVLVSNGTYNLTNQISILSNITVRSFSEQGHGTNDTFINGGFPVYTNRCFYMTNGLVNGFTITNGFSTSGSATEGGGGVMLKYGGTVTNCVIMYNICSNANNWTGGGGVYFYSGGTVANCVIISNTVSSNAASAVYNLWGGGVYAYYGGSILNCIVRGNVAKNYAGIVQEYGDAILTSGCTIYENIGGSAVRIEGGQVRDSVISNNVGGNGVDGLFSKSIVNCHVVGHSGVGISAGYPGVISNCFIARNNAVGLGGGAGINISGLYGFYIVDRCVITANIASNYGAGINCGYAGFVKNCLIYNNTNLGANGGGIQASVVAVGNSTAGVYNCTIVSNYAYSQGGGISGLGETNRIINCIIYDNTCTAPVYNDVFNSPTSNTNNYFACCTSVRLAPNQGNITNNPLFKNANVGNWRLNDNSLCLNAGTNASPIINGTDLDGRTRIRYGAVDIGAYELIRSGTTYGFH